VAAACSTDLVMADNLRISEVTRCAYEQLGQNGTIAAASDHECSECTQPYKATPDIIANPGAATDLLVVDGIVVGPKHCAFDECTDELTNNRGGVYCAYHQLYYGRRCHIVGCSQLKVAGTQACTQHQNEW
ncbi:hypothetical protein BDN72DRAFT_736315, partial [Pluteus cervinus]